MWARRWPRPTAAPRRRNPRRAVNVRASGDPRGVPPTGVAPPSLVLRDPSEGGPAGRARELRSGLRSVGAAGVAIPAVILGNVRQLKTAPRTRMLDAGGGDRRGLRD